MGGGQHLLVLYCQPSDRHHVYRGAVRHSHEPLTHDSWFPTELVADHTLITCLPMHESRDRTFTDHVIEGNDNVAVMH